MRVVVERGPSLEARDGHGQEPDYIGVLEAAYRLDLTDGDWLAGILSTLRPALDEGAGVFGWIHEPDRLDPHGGSPTAVGVDDLPAVMAVRAAVAGRLTQTEADGVMKARPLGRWLSALGVSPERLAGFRSAYEPLGICDFNDLKCFSPGIGGPMLSAGLPGPRRMHPRRRDALERVAVHIAAAHRLRRQASGAPDAILDPSGQVLHVEAAAESRRAQESLASAVGEIEQARGPLRREAPGRALALWRTLVAGQWTLIETLESDGRRSLAARRNPPGAVAPLSLSPRERDVIALLVLGHSEKLVAYALGLARSTVSGATHAALAKLGLRSRMELLQMFSLAGPRHEGGASDPPAG